MNLRNVMGTRVAVIAAAAVAISCVGTAFALSGSPIPSPPGAPPATRAAIAAEVPATLSNAFDVLRAGPETALAPAAAAPNAAALSTYFANSGLTAGFGLNTGLARQAATTPDPAWVVPGSEGVCIYVQAGSVGVGTCGTTAQALAGALYFTGPGANSSAGGSGPIMVFGLAPDGNGAVSMTSLDGTPTLVPVVQNVYEAPVGKAGLATLHVLTSSGRPSTLTAGN